MEQIFEWLIHIPQYLGDFASWLSTDIAIGSFHASPLVILGSGAVAFVGIVLTLHIVHLIIG